jgi:hypothetical protein
MTHVVEEYLASLPDDEPARPAYEMQRKLRPAPVGELPDYTPLDQLPSIIDAAVQRYLADPDPQRALLLALPPGSGKTTAMVHVAEQVAASGRRVLYAGPRHDLYDDVIDKAQRPAWWYHWMPRQKGDEQREETCRWAPQMAAWLQRGYEAMTMCRNERICGYSYLNTQCPYHQQRNRREPILYVQHQHVFLGHPLMEEASLLIGDELPIGALTRAWTIPAAEITMDTTAPDISRALWTLRSLTTAKPPDDAHHWSGVAVLNALGGAVEALAFCRAHSLLRPGIDTDAPDLRDPNDVERQPYNYLPYLLSLLEQEATAAINNTPYVERIIIDKRGLTLLMRRRPPQRKLPRHIIWCDGTGDARLYEQILCMPVEEVRPVVPLTGTVYQVATSINNRSAMRVEDGDDAKLQRIRQQIDAIRERPFTPGVPPYENLVTITYKAAKDALGADGHFGAERGTNRYEQCDALVVVGTPQPPTHAIVQTAAMLFDTRITPPFNAEWTTREVAYDGQPFAIPVAGFWSDADLQLLLEQQRDAELIQTLYRARPLRRQVDVYLLTSIPLRGIVTKLVQTSDLFGAPPGVDVYRWLRVRDWVLQTLAERGIITTPELAAHANIQAAAARRWLTSLSQQIPHTTIGTAPSTGRGKPPLALRVAL